MLSPNLTILHILFISISLLGGMAAIYFWIKVYEDTKKVCCLASSAQTAYS
jgi:hypothetical protein